VADAEPTEDYSLALVCARVPNSIVCLLSALRVHGIGAQTPPAVWIGIPQKARAPRVPEVRVRVVRFSSVAWRLGVKEVRFEGVPARITSPARTIVDCFRFQRLIGPEIPREALDDALRRRIVTIAELSRIEQDLPSRVLRAALDLKSI
jgi:predicted transcriptional regulator of viral defense system